MNFLRLLLLPLSLIYGLIVYLRNRFYDFGFLKSTRFNIPVIVVGNLEVGGSGKSPMVELLITLLKDKYKIAVLSRGYGRVTKGFKLVETTSKSHETGDEPLQFKRKFPEITVAVCEDRVAAIHQLKAKHNLILCDDAYQHRALKPGFSVLLFNYQQINRPAFLLPAGNYRDLFMEKKRANIIVVTKTPKTLSASEKEQIIQKLKPLPHQQVFFSYLAYADDLLSLKKEPLKATELANYDEILTLTGIAKPDLFIEKLNEFKKPVVHHAYPDHHQFSTKNMLKLAVACHIGYQKKIIITTEKDAMRLSATALQKVIKNLPIYYWPVQTVFSDDEAQKFEQEIITYVDKY